jgi:hypothetical protein
VAAAGYQGLVEMLSDLNHLGTSTRNLCRYF